MQSRNATCWLLLTLVFALPAHATSQRVGETAAAKAGTPVRPGVWKLDGYEPGLRADDLTPLKTLLAGASFVGLGEQVHTTGGTYQMKHRLIRYLVSEMGYRLLAFESPAVGAERLEAYVQSCAGTPADGIRTIFGVWRSTEVADVAEWLCEWNRGHDRPRDKVHVIGFDIQDAYGQTQSDVAALRAYLARVGVGPADSRSADLDDCDGVVLTEDFASPERYVPCNRALKGIEKLFREEAERLAELTSPRDLAWARLHLRNVRAWEDESYALGFDAHYEAGYTARDRGMANNLLETRRLLYPDAKTILWAHNNHLNQANTNPFLPRITYMGEFLRQALGSAYRVIAISAFATETDWAGGPCGPIPAIGLPGSVEKRLHDLGAGDVLVDLRRPGVIPRVLPKGQLQFGTNYIVPARNYDLLISLERSPSMHPLAWASCR